MNFKVDVPYNDLPALPPSVDLESRAIMRRCIAAQKALEKLRCSALLLPNPELFISVLPMIESQASSAIENIITTTDLMFRHAVWNPRLDHRNSTAIDPSTKEALRYNHALNKGIDLLKARPLSTSIAIEVCRSIKGIDLDIRKTPGTQLKNQATGSIIYTPPSGQKVIQKKLKNWEEFLHSSGDDQDSGIHPLIKLAVMHYQFEAIHPFIDGNGRTGRILNLLYLIEQNLLDSPILYLSQYIITHRSRYYQLLRGVTEEYQWEPWIIYMLDAIEHIAEHTYEKIQRIHDLFTESREKLRQCAPHLLRHQLLELTFTKPYCGIVDLVQAGIAQRQSASQYLKQLAALSLLGEEKAGRHKLYVNRALLSLLSEPFK